MTRRGAVPEPGVTPRTATGRRAVGDGVGDVFAGGLDVEAGRAEGAAEGDAVVLGADCAGLPA